MWEEIVCQHDEGQRKWLLNPKYVMPIIYFLKLNNRYVKMKMSRKELFLKYVWSVFADKSENVDTDGALCVVFSYTKVHCPGK